MTLQILNDFQFNGILLFTFIITFCAGVGCGMLFLTFGTSIGESYRLKKKVRAMQKFNRDNKNFKP